MRNRKQIPRKQSENYFTKTARKVHRKNNIGGLMVGPMRGGIRL